MGSPSRACGGNATTLGHMPLAVKKAYALLEGELGSTIVPGRVAADQESPCSATAMRKVMRRMTQPYNPLALTGLRTTGR